MRTFRIVGIVSALALLAGGPALSETAGKSGAWAERVQIVYRAETKSVLRKTVKAWDAAPEKNLDFVWEPEAGQPGDGLAEDGTIAGKGELVWRVRGSASYDPATVYSVYTGELRDGRPNGKGRLEIRSGEIFEGTFADGLLNGKGMHVDAAGNRFEGEFRDNLLDGKGRLRARTGEIFTGMFVGGKKHGTGETRLPGGTVYASEWAMGIEVSARPDMVADAAGGGLIKVQSDGALLAPPADGGAAGKVEIGVVVDQRMTQQSEMQYQHLVRDEDIAIYPVSQEINDFWNGAAEVGNMAYVFDGIDWEESPSFVEVDLGTTDGSRVRLDKMELRIAASDTYRKPMLTIDGHVGCVGFRPDFTVLNRGWGEVKDLKMSIQFAAEEPDGNASPVYTRDIGTFDAGKDISIRDVLDEAGVDTAKLTDKRFSCQSIDSINVCRSQVFNDVGFGTVADFVWGEQKLFTTAIGKFDYAWSDDDGNTYQVSEPFRTTIALATIEVPDEMAECGDGFGGSPEALRYQDVKLQLGQQNYVVDMPLRGNRNVKNYLARLKMSAERSSFHQFKVAAEFQDGSTRESKTVSLFYFRPRVPNFFTAMQPAACYLPETSAGC